MQTGGMTIIQILMDAKSANPFLDSCPSPKLQTHTPPASLASLIVCLTLRCQLCITVHREMSTPYVDLGLSLSHLDIINI